MFNQILKSRVSSVCLALGYCLTVHAGAVIEEPADDFRVFGVGIIVDVQGQLETGAGDGKISQLDMTASARISYRERRLVGLGLASESLRSVREYENGQSSVQVVNEQTKSELGPESRLIVAQGKPDGLELFSLRTLLTAKELDLLRTPGDSLLLTGLLPSGEVSAGDKYTPADWALQALVGLEALTKKESEAEVVLLNDAEAKLKVTGKMEGAIAGAASVIEIEALLSYDRKSKAIVAATITQTESRTIGPISPGLKVKARINLKRRPANDPGRLGDAQLIEEATSAAKLEQLSLRFDTPWSLSAVYHRNWRLFHELPTAVVFRLVDDGVFIAQCNLNQLPNVNAGEHTSEKDFETDIKKSLGERFEEIVDRSVVRREDHRFQYRVVVQGKAGTRQMTWIYYLLTDTTGRQVSAVFSVDRLLEKDFGDRHAEFMQGMKFLTKNPATNRIR